MRVIVGQLTMRPELVGEITPILENIQTETRREDGCIGYEVHTSLENPAKFVLIERWATEEAFRNHIQQPHVQAWRTVSHKYVVARDVDIFYVDRTEKLPAMPAH